jgi:hypothetical protein
MWTWVGSNVSSKEKLREIVNRFIELLELMKSHELPSHATLSEKLYDLVDSTMQCNAIQERFTRADLEDRFSMGIEMYLQKELTDKTRQDVETYIRELFATKVLKYRFFFPMPELLGFSDRFRLGYGELISFQKLPAPVRAYVSEEYAYRNKREGGYRTTSKYGKTRRDELYLSLEVASFAREKAITLATEKANESLSVLKAVYGKHLSVLRECYYIIDEKTEIGRVRPEGLWPQPHWKNPRYDEMIDKINSMYATVEPNELQRRMKNSIYTYGMIEKAMPIETKFLLTVISIEGLIISYEERDYIGWKFREKIAILLGDTIEWMAFFLRKNQGAVTNEDIESNLVSSRIELSRRIGDVYDKRSRLAHLSVEKKKSRKGITDEDLLFVEWMYHLLLDKLMKLCLSEGLETIEKTKEKKSLNSYLEKIKFGARSNII